MYGSLAFVPLLFLLFPPQFGTYIALLSCCCTTKRHLSLQCRVIGWSPSLWLMLIFSLPAPTYIICPWHSLTMVLFWKFLMTQIPLSFGCIEAMRLSLSIALHLPFFPWLLMTPMAAFLLHPLCPFRCSDINLRWQLVILVDNYTVLIDPFDWFMH